MNPTITLSKLAPDQPPDFLQAGFMTLIRRLACALTHTQKKATPVTKPEKSFMQRYPKLAELDRQVAEWMVRYGHMLHRFSMAILFIWLGLLKQAGLKTTTSLLAHTVYFGTPEIMVPVLGWWEVVIGICLLFRKLIRVALLLLLIRLPGTLLALFLLPDVCFVSIPFAPTPEGQYLIKDLMLFSAAVVIGGTIRVEKQPGIFH